MLDGVFIDRWSIIYQLFPQLSLLPTFRCLCRVAIIGPSTTASSLPCSTDSITTSFSVRDLHFHGYCCCRYKSCRSRSTFLLFLKVFEKKNVEYIHIIRSISFGISMSPFSTFYHIWLSFLFKVGIYSQVFHWKYLNCLTNFKVSSTFADIALPFVSGTVDWWEILDQF